jgi:peptidyl-prolyl cis-trans isomerase SurA
MKGARSKGILAFSVLLVIFFFCLESVCAEIFNRVVAIVNDDVITLHELNQRIKEMTGSKAADLKLRDEQKYLEARRQENVKSDLERLKLINTQVKSKIIIREEQLKQYYEEHKADFNTEETVHLAGIFLMGKNPKDEKEFREMRMKGEDILSWLKEGEDFAELARTFSQGPGADEGGNLGTFKTAQLEPELRKMVEATPVGGFSDLIIRPNGIQIIKVVNKRGGEEKTFEEVKDAIHSVLYQKEVNKRYASWIRQLRKDSYTRITF